MSKTKKIIVICSMVVLLVATAYVNILLNDESRKASAVTNQPAVSAFAQFRNTRESSRNLEFEYLNGVIGSEDVSVASKQSAEQLKLDIVKKMESEMILEELIKASGFSDAIVTMNEDSLNVVVSGDALSGQQVAQICTLVLRETEYTLDQIAINTYS